MVIFDRNLRLSRKQCEMPMVTGTLIGSRGCTGYNGIIFDDLEPPLTQVSRSLYTYITLLSVQLPHCLATHLSASDSLRPWRYTNLHSNLLTSRISQKRCVLRTKLLKNTNRKPYSIYQMAPLSMHCNTFNDLE